MEGLYGWLVVFAGGAIGLLGTFLFASERELKGKRLECEELRARHAAEHHDGGPAKPSENQGSAELTANNQELLDQISSLSSRLEQSQRTVEELREEQERVVPEYKSENQSLRAANEQQEQEIKNLRSRLQENETRLSQAVGEREESAGREAQLLQSQLGELQGQLEKLTVDKQATLEELDSVSSKFSASEKSLEDLRTVQQDTQFEYRRLQAAKQDLEQQNAELTERLRQNETRLAELAQSNNESAARCTELQSQLAFLEQQAEQIRSQARDFEVLQQQLVAVESREAVFKAQQQELEAQVADLQRELTAGNDRVRKLETSCRHLAETEQECRELREQNRRLEEEISNGRERLAASEGTQRELARLRRQMEELEARQAPPMERDEPVAEALRPIELTQESITPAAHEVAAPFIETASSERKTLVVELGEYDRNSAQLNSDPSLPLVQGANGETIKTAPGVSAGRKRHSRLVPAGLALGLIAVTAVGFLATRSSEKLAAVPESVTDEPAATTEAPVAAQEAKQAPSVHGAFRITRQTAVYSGPNEMTALIANIGPGMKINVVDSRDGWLEIRSKHGRPPGFVRQEAAVRIDQK